MARNNNNGEGPYTGVIRLAAFVAIFITAFVVMLRWILNAAFDAGLGGPVGYVLDITALITMVIALGLAGWEFVANRSWAWRIVYIIAVIVWILFAVLGIFGVAH